MFVSRFARNCSLALVSTTWVPSAACANPGTQGTESDSLSTSSEAESTGSTGASSGEEEEEETTSTSAETGEGCGEDCDIWDPASCAEGDKCTAVSCAGAGAGWDANYCRNIQGDDQLGDPCSYIDGDSYSGNDTCALGLMCWNVDPDTAMGSCSAFCTGSVQDPTCPAGFECPPLGDGVVPLCKALCDPLAQDCSTEGEFCLPNSTGTGFTCVPDQSGDMSPYGTLCELNETCNIGLLCIDGWLVPEAACAMSNGCCSPICDLSMPAACPGTGQTCEPYYLEGFEPAGYENIGICKLVP